MANVKLAGITVKLDDSVGSRIAEQARGNNRVASALIEDLVDQIRRELVADTKIAMDFDDDIDADLDDIDFEAAFEDFDLDAQTDFEADFDDLDLDAEIDEILAEDEVEGLSEMGRAMKKRRGKKSKDKIIKYIGCKKPTADRGLKGGAVCKYTCWGKSRSGKMRALNLTIPKGKGGSCKPLKELKGKSVHTLNKPPKQ